MRKTKNIIKILIISIILLMFTGNLVPVHAEGIGDVLNAGRDFITQGKNSMDQDLTVEYFGEEFIGIGQILVAIGLVTVTIVFVVMAIKWITAKPDQQAALKQQLVGLVVSAIVIFGALGIWSVVKNILENVEAQL